MTLDFAVGFGRMQMVAGSDFRFRRKHRHKAGIIKRLGLTQSRPFLLALPPARPFWGDMELFRGAASLVIRDKRVLSAA